MRINPFIGRTALAAVLAIAAPKAIYAQTKVAPKQPSTRQIVLSLPDSVTATVDELITMKYKAKQLQGRYYLVDSIAKAEKVQALIHEMDTLITEMAKLNTETAKLSKDDIRAKFYPLNERYKAIKEELDALNTVIYKQ